MPTVFESAGVYPGICCTLEWSLDQDPTNDGGTKELDWFGPEVCGPRVSSG